MFNPVLARILLGVSAAPMRQAAYVEKRRSWAEACGRPYPPTTKGTYPL